MLPCTRCSFVQHVGKAGGLTGLEMSEWVPRALNAKATRLYFSFASTLPLGIRFFCGTSRRLSVISRVVHIMLNISHYFANSLCSTTVSIMLK